MTIKPVLVPDHDAVSLRGLMDRFADASTGPTRQELTESRAAVAAAQGVAEGVKKMSPQQQHDFDRMRYGAMSRKEYDAKWKKPLKSDDEVIYGKKKSVAEFATSDSGDGGGDDDGFDEDTLRKLAAQWFNGDEDPQVERLLAAAGWEIGQDEGYDDEPGVFVVLSGDDDGRSYISWPAEEMRSTMSEGKKRADRYHIVGKDGNPASLVGYADQASAVKDRDDKHPGAEVRQVGPRGKIKDVAEAGAEDNEGNPVVSAILRRILHNPRHSVIERYGARAVMDAVKEVADFVGDVEEIGSSDVSGWVRHVEQMLGNMEPGVTEQQVDELSPKTLGSYIKKSSSDAAERQGEVSGRNQFGKGAEFAVKAFYGDQIQPNPTRTDSRIAKRQAGIDQAVDRLTAEDVAESRDPIEQLRADIRRFSR